MDIIFEKLKAIPHFEAVPDEQLQWLAERCDITEMKKGEALFTPGDSIDRLLIISKGSFTFKIQQGNQLQTSGKFKAPSITGLLPYSRATTAFAFSEADEDAEFISLNKKHIRDMICDCHELTTVLVHEMSSRIRQFTKSAQMNDKMMSLGKLSAGLAHELNNPSAAVVRNSQELSKIQKSTPERFKAVLKIKLDDKQVDQVSTLLFERIQSGVVDLSLMERSDLEDEMIDWLMDHDVEEPEDITDNAIDYGFTLDDFEKIGKVLPEEHLDAVLQWINQVLATEKLIDGLADASGRISELVHSIKSYTHMDQAPEMVPTDIHIGLNNTLTMLNHKLKSNKIQVIKKYGEELPKANVLPSAINQVWTNILDNAIDAMEHASDRNLEVSTYTSGKYLNVEIKDSGTGIPDDVKDKIFDPFFTTKTIGKGTGLGLENVMQIVKIQHNGSIDVQSKPGETIFSISLPIN